MFADPARQGQHRKSTFFQLLMAQERCLLTGAFHHFHPNQHVFAFRVFKVFDLMGLIERADMLHFRSKALELRFGHEEAARIGGRLMARPAFDTLMPIAKCLLGLAACLSIAEEALETVEARFHNRTSSSAAVLSGIQFLLFLNGQPPFRSRENVRHLDQYFSVTRTTGPTVTLSQKNDGTYRRIATAIARLIAERLPQFDQRLSIMRSGLDVKEDDNIVVGFLEEVSSRLATFSIKQQNNDLYIKDAIKSHNITALSNDHDVDQFLRRELGSVKNIKHHIFKSCDLFDFNIVKSQLTGLIYDQAEYPEEAGLYMVVREARGFAETPSENANLIVRDLLLMLPNKDVKGGGILGIYISTIDRGSFQLLMAEADTGTWHITGHLPSSPVRQQRLDLRFPAMHGQTWPMRCGLLSGSILREGGARLAAWKVIVTRSPSELSHGYKGHVECFLFLVLTENINECVPICEALNIIGVLHNKFIAKDNADIRNRRISFRRLVQDDVAISENVSLDVGGFVKSKIEGILEEVADSIMNESSSGMSFYEVEERRRKEIKETVNRIEAELKSSWSLLNPAQISIDKRYGEYLKGVESERQVLEDLARLTGTEHIYQHKDWHSPEREAHEVN